MREFTAFLASTLILTMIGWYSLLIWRRQVAPALSTWILFWVAVAISLRTYFASPSHALLSNITNLTDGVGVSIVLTVLVLRGGRDQWRFNKLDLICLAISAAILEGWHRMGHELIANYAIQTVIAIAYIPMIDKVLKGKKESFGYWFGFWVASILALYPAYTDPINPIAKVYATRSFLSISILLAVIKRAEIANLGRALFLITLLILYKLLPKENHSGMS